MKFYSKMLLLTLLGPLLSTAGPVNINAADALTLARELKGIGPARANAIIVYRQQHGPFRSVDELALIKGIGKSVIERNRADLRLSNAPGVPPRANANVPLPAVRPPGR